jgi:hypothetical protein
MLRNCLQIRAHSSFLLGAGHQQIHLQAPNTHRKPRVSHRTDLSEYPSYGKERDVTSAKTHRSTNHRSHRKKPVHPGHYGRWRRNGWQRRQKSTCSYERNRYPMKYEVHDNSRTIDNEKPKLLQRIQYRFKKAKHVARACLRVDRRRLRRGTELQRVRCL